MVWGWANRQPPHREAEEKSENGNSANLTHTVAKSIKTQQQAQKTPQSDAVELGESKWNGGGPLTRSRANAIAIAQANGHKTGQEKGTDATGQGNTDNEGWTTVRRGSFKAGGRRPRSASPTHGDIFTQTAELRWMIFNPPGDGNCIFWSLLLGVHLQRRGEQVEASQQLLAFSRDQAGKKAGGEFISNIRTWVTNKVRDEIGTGRVSLKDDEAKQRRTEEALRAMASPGHWGDQDGDMVALVNSVFKLEFRGREQRVTSETLHNTSVLVSIVRDHCYVIANPAEICYADVEHCLGLDGARGLKVQFPTQNGVQDQYSQWVSSRPCECQGCEGDRVPELPASQEVTPVRRNGRGRPKHQEQPQFTDKIALDLVREADQSLKTCFCGAAQSNPLALLRHITDKHPTTDTTSLVEHCVEHHDLGQCPRCMKIGKMNKAKTGILNHKCQGSAALFQSPREPIRSAATPTATQAMSQTDADAQVLVTKRYMIEMLRNMEKVYKDKSLGAAAHEATVRDAIAQVARINEPVVIGKSGVPMRSTEELAAAALYRGDNNQVVKLLESRGLADVEKGKVMEKYPHLIEGPCVFNVKDSEDEEPIRGKEVVEFLRSRQNRTSRGPDGIRIGFLSNLCEDPEAADLVALLVDLLRSSKYVSNETRLIINGVRLVTLHKDGPPGSFRPIGVATALGRVYQGMVGRRTRGEVASRLHTDNYTLAPSGTTVIALATQATLEKGGVAVSVDIKEAFQGTSMEEVGRISAKRGMTEFQAALSTLTMHRVTHHEHGTFMAGHIPQGSSLGTSAMAVKMDDVLEETRQTHQRAAILGLADDTTILAKSVDIRDAALADATASFQKGSLQERESKRLYIDDEHVAGGRIVGAHLGEGAMAAVAHTIDEIIEKVEALVNIVSKLKVTDGPVRQTALRVLRMNYLQRAVYLLQHHSIDLTLESTQMLDVAFLRAFAALFELSDEEAGRTEAQIRLPTSMGGFGISSMQDARVLQRIGAIARTIGEVSSICRRVFNPDPIGVLLREVPELVAQARALAAIGPEDPISQELDLLEELNRGEGSLTGEQAKQLRTLQGRLSTKYHEAAHKAWRASFEPRNLLQQEQLESISAKESGRPLNVTTTFGLHQMDDPSFILWVRRRALLPLVPLGIGPCACCGDDMDDHAEHMIKCAKLGRGPAHYSVKQAVLRASREIARCGNVEVRDEPSLETYTKIQTRTVNSASDNTESPEATAQAPRLPGAAQNDEKTRADVGIYDRIKRTTILIDIRTCALARPDSLNEIGATVHKGEAAKRTSYMQRYEFPEGVTFVPFAIDSYGRWGESYKEHLKNWCKQAAGQHHGLYNTLITRARDWIAVANARAVGNRVALGLSRCLPEASLPRTATRRY